VFLLSICTALACTSCDSRTSTSAVLSTPGSIAGHAWHDRDCDGLQGADEPGLAGVTVVLESAALGQRAALTGLDGSFAFRGLLPDVYSVDFDAQNLPAGFTPTVCGVGENREVDSDCVPAVVELAPDQDAVVDFGFVDEACLEPGVIGGLVWHDRNCDGLQSNDEPGIEGVRVSMQTPVGSELVTWTEADGRFGFLALAPGTYVLCYDEQSVPTGFEPTDCGVGDDRNVDSDCCPAVVALGSKQGVSVDFGFRGPCCVEVGAIGGFAWHDLDCNGLQNKGEPELAGLRVLLHDENGGLRAAHTSELGRFAFEDLCPGVYWVVYDPESLPTGFAPTPCEVGDDPKVDSDCIPVEVALEAGGGFSVDFGFRGVCCRGQGRIGNRVWYDVDCDGLQTPGEPGIAGVRVVLTDDLGGQLVTTTDAEGRYEFSGLCRATYFVCYDPQSVPGTFAPATCGVGEDRALDSDCCPAVVELLLSSSEDATIDFGFVSPCCDEPGTLVSRVWQDLDCNGRQDPHEPGIPGVRVVATGAGSEELAAVTNADGEALLLGLCAGAYTLCFDAATVPLGLAPTACGAGPPGLDSDCCPAVFELGPGGFTVQTLDFGFVNGCCGGLGRIGDRVWLDLDVDGQQTPGEPGIAGARVVLEDALGARFDTHAGEDGRYEFVGLCPGNYTLCVDPLSLPAGLVPTPCEAGGSQALDSNCCETEVVLQPGMESDLSVDFGFAITSSGLLPVTERADARPPNSER
jgi:hypothetical protein